MSGIDLSDDGRFIRNPSGRKITASQLEVGKTYLHKHPVFYRRIVAIDGNHVYYLDNLNLIRPYRCGKPHFSSICPNEATEEEIKFIDENSSMR